MLVLIYLLISIGWMAKTLLNLIRGADKRGYRGLLVDTVAFWLSALFGLTWPVWLIAEVISGIRK